MAKKRASNQEEDAAEVVRQPPLDEDWVEDVPAPVQDAVDEYMKRLRAKHRATELVNSAKENCISIMKEHGIKQVRIDEGAKWLKVEDEPKLKTEKIKSPAYAGGDDDDD
ncbi:hypothetical protein [Planctomicrobium piriforme]|uniref:Uncharacterized protein n=1 Tax=Planctomicrobium piriforme TaxID=1576369 RepID=A0A1I3EFR8_9PLAN|nr:hypothetical protein [Planctomicrobium piriforme]SFH97764.1 hypothetical protein SAMN05421753_104202 [Planctomicrobium piriforme]